MARLLCTVEDVFFIAGRGSIPSPPIVPQDGERILVGDHLLLKRPDGSTVRTQITGLASIHRPTIGGYVLDVLLKGVSGEDIPPGTEIWSVDNC